LPHYQALKEIIYVFLENYLDAATDQKLPKILMELSEVLSNPQKGKAKLFSSLKHDIGIEAKVKL
jgi:hypothetical protein